MSGLRPPGRGPIVGHTTDSTCRLWIRAGDPGDQGPELDSDRRTVGVLAVLDANGQPVDGPPAYFRLHREFDRTGSFNLGADVSLGANPGDHRGHPFPLAPETEYLVGLGTLTIDDPSLSLDDTIPDDALATRLPQLGPWVIDELRRMPSEAKALFRTFPAAGGVAPQLAFVVGSCRYPGLLAKIKLADRIFGPMASQLLDPAFGPPARFVVMVGDQIYADKFNRLIPIGRADTYAEFQERYLTAFGTTNMRRLLRSVPTYMILDDHEIEDNWTQDRLCDPGIHFLFTYAIGAYMSYQWSHGPRTFGRRLYYQFECGGYPFFVLDTRTQRYKNDVVGELKDNHMLGRPSLHPDEPNQLDTLLAWLTHQQATRGDIPKFIVSSSVFVPNDISERYGEGKAKDAKRLEQSDSWPAYPGTRRTILNCVVKNNIQNVIFLSGDIHCSNIAELSFTQKGAPLNLRAFSVTSSAFYWPFPFADGDPANYVHDSTAPGQEDTFPISAGVTMDYRAWNFTQDDNYCRLILDQPSSTLRVIMFDSSGAKVEVGVAGAKRPLDEMLQLAPW